MPSALCDYIHISASARLNFTSPPALPALAPQGAQLGPAPAFSLTGPVSVFPPSQANQDPVHTTVLVFRWKLRILRAQSVLGNTRWAVTWMTLKRGHPLSFVDLGLVSPLSSRLFFGHKGMSHCKCWLRGTGASGRLFGQVGLYSGGCRSLVPSKTRNHITLTSSFPAFMYFTRFFILISSRHLLT